MSRAELFGMRRRRRSAAGIVWCWSVAAALLLAAHVPAGPARAARPQHAVSGTGAPRDQAPEAAALTYFIGSWDVTATTPGTGETLEVAYEIRPLVGTWLSGRATSRQPGLEASDIWGRDLASGEIMRTIFDGSGTHAVVRSPGWEGKILRLEGDARSAGGIVRVRETITQIGQDQFTATWEAYRDGSWIAYSIERATRRRGSTTNSRVGS